MRPLAVAVELAFLGHALEGFPRTLDPVLVFVPIGRQQLDDFIAAAGAGTPHGAGGKINRLADVKFVRLRSRFACGSRRGCIFAGGFFG